VKEEKLPKRRVYVLVAIMAVWGLAIGARLYFLQVVESADYLAKARDQQQFHLSITPRRGDLVDRNGNKLAGSVKVDSVGAHPSHIKNPQETARVLSRLTGISSEKLLRQFVSKSKFVWIKRKVGVREKDAIEQAKLPGIVFLKEFQRYYPHREMAAHVLGYVDIDEKGMTGLEARYKGVIQGEPGKILMFRDAKGTSYQREEQVARAGANLVTTIDREIQFIVETELKAAFERTRADAISIVVMDPGSGAILAMANAPNFNPNKYKAFKEETWINHSVSLTYEPGSTFKMVTVAAALEEGLTTPDEIIDCLNGLIVVAGGRRIKDHDPYGLLSVREIIQHSSNVGTIRLAQRLGDDRLASYVERFGFGKRTGVDLPAEVGGLVRNTKNWSANSYASIAIGQELSVTPLQIASMMSTIANGGTLYKPYIVQRIEDPLGGTTEIKPSGRRVISEVTAQQLQEMLEGVVTGGTGRFNQLEGYTAAGKTGTAQKALLGGGGYASGKYVASFAGYAPASRPQLAIVVVVDEPKGKYYGAEVAAPVFKRIAERVLGNKAVLPDVPDYAPQYSATPKKGKSKAEPRVPPAALPEFKVLDAALISPAGAGGELQFGEILVPDFSGQSLRQALVEAGKLGVEPVMTGSGRVFAQYPPAGSRVTAGARVQLKLSQ
jgi:cell division protein FtsI (penicillin-binding protein 3)